MIPVTATTCVSTNAGVFLNATMNVTSINSPCLTMSTSLNTQVGFAVYAITITTIIGWVLLCFFLPTGVWAYPFDYIGSWV